MKALLIVGSPRGQASASRALGGYLLRRLRASGLDVEEAAAGAVLGSPERRHALYKASDEADIVIVSFPLYVDQLPAPLVQALELLAERRRGAMGLTPWPGPFEQKLAAIVQSGFPETSQNLVAVDIMRQFAKEAGFRWAGGLALGMGGAVGRRPLEKAGGRLRNVVKALDIAAASLAAGGDIPDGAAALMARPLMPFWLYRAAATWGFRRRIRKNGARTPRRPT
ncbi:MAG TPA: NAD(P)H-dependent oxidoreductase [Candidatus Aminicenantes bacterium]|nr:NAD(P)H-dependent oxidoreductase [Candidatus Aminicenantes bacterium]